MRSILYSIVIVISINLVTVNTALDMTPMISLADPKLTVEQEEKACSLFCKLALVADKFVTIPKGKTTFMWVRYFGVVKVAETIGLIAIPSLGTAAMLIAVMCSSAYGICTIVGPEAIGNQEFINMPNKWCTKTYVGLFYFVFRGA